MKTYAKMVLMEKGKNVAEQLSLFISEPIKDRTKQEVRQFINETNSQDADETSKQEKRKIYSHYRNLKKEVFDLELNNTNHLYFFPSSDTTTNSKKFYILGGNSAIIFTQELAPRINQSNQLRHDSDLGDYKFYTGVCSTSNLDGLIKKLSTIGVKREKDIGEIISLKLARHYSKTEIKEMLRTKETELEKFNKLIYPESLYPDIHKLLVKLKKEIPPKIKKLNSRYYDTFGKDLHNSLITLTKTYLQLTRGHIDKKIASKQMLISLDEILNQLSILNDLGAWEISTCSRIGEIASDLETLITGRILNKCD